jgi:hypothetical protein
LLIGHISLAYAARARWPRAELVALIVATMLPDLADLALPQGHRCRANCGLYTHAFPAFLVLAAVAAVFAWFIWHRRAAVLLAAALVISHVALDLLTGDKQFWVGGPKTGLALYYHEGWDFVIEATMMTTAWYVLRRTARAPRIAVNVATLIALLSAQGVFDIWLYSRRL